MVIPKSKQKKKKLHSGFYLLQPTPLFLVFMGFIVFLIGASAASLSRSALEKVDTVEVEDLSLQSADIEEEPTPTPTPTPLR